MSKKPLAVGVAALVVIAIGLVAWNEAGNASARAELDEACACARRSVRDTLVQSGPVLADLFEDDEPMVRGFLTEEVALLCAELEGELVPLRWNVGRTFTPSLAPARAAEIREALARARPRCSRAFGVGEARANELCDSLFAGLEPGVEPTEPESAWAWPEGIRSSMCLEEPNNARAGARERP